MEILERSLFRVTRDGDLEVADEADDLLEAVELQLLRARFGEVTRLEVSESMSPAMLEQLQQGLRVPDELVYPLDGMLDLADLGQLYAARPAGSQERAVGAGRAAAVEHDRVGTGSSSRDPCRRPPRPPPLRLVRGQLRVVRRPRRGRSRGDRDQVDRVPDERRHAARAGADRRLGARQADASASSRSRRAATNAATSSGRERWSRRASTSSTASRGSRSTRRRRWSCGARRAGCAATSIWAPATTTPSPPAVYEDFGLFTADEEIAADVADFFNHLTGFGRPGEFRKLLVAPFTLRSAADRGDPAGRRGSRRRARRRASGSR